MMQKVNFPLIDLNSIKDNKKVQKLHKLYSFSKKFCTQNLNKVQMYTMSQSLYGFLKYEIKIHY